MSETPPRDAMPLEHRMDELRRAGKALAERHGIRVDEVFHPKCANKEEMQQRLAKLKAEMPEAPSAYQPSGKISAWALLFFPLGLGTAVCTAVLAELIAAAIGAFMILMALLLVNAGGCLWFLAVILLIIAGLYAHIMPFLAGGGAAGWVTSKFGRLGKNRNPTVAALLSVLASGTSVAILWGAFVLLQTRFVNSLEAQDTLWLEVGTWQIIGHLLHGIGAVIAMVVAPSMAISDVQSAKFCESCEQFMDETHLKKLCAGGVKAMRQALADDEIPVAASLLSCDAANDGMVSLFTCPCCDSGCVELTIQFQANLVDFVGKPQAESWAWSVASVQLDDKGVAWFRIFKEQKTKGTQPVSSCD